MMKRSLFAFGPAVALLLLGSTIASAGQVVYNQAPVPFNQTFTLWASDDNVLNGISTVYDDFTLGSTVPIDGVNWYGAWVDVISLVGAPSDALSWEIGFWADNLNFPGVNLELVSLSLVSVNAVSQGIHNWRNGQAEVFSFSAALPTPFVATAGTKYWLSIQEKSDITSQTVAFGWYEKDGLDGLSWQVFNGAAFAKTDRAFSLTTTVPEPGSMLVMGIGLLAIVPFRRWKSAERKAIN